MKNAFPTMKWSLLFVGFLIVSLSSNAKNKLYDLVCEYRVNPVGIDVAKPRLSWKLKTDDSNVMQSAYEIRVTTQPGKGEVIWSSGKTASDQSVDVEYAGPQLTSMQRVYWQVRVWDNHGKATEWSSPAFWETGILMPTEWTASWITDGSQKEKEQANPSPYFRKEFVLTKRVKSARVYVTAHGLYELFLNGQKVSQDLFTPGWTSYNKRLQYQTYDVTGLLTEKNAIGAVLGDGWYRGHTGIESTDYYGKELALLLQLVVQYTDGTSEFLVTDNSWKTAYGPILAGDNYNGETYDARLEMPGWNEFSFDDLTWKSVQLRDEAKNILVAPQGVPVKAIEEIKPLKIIHTPAGETVFDMGQNMVGWVRLKVSGNKGDEVVLKFAEVLDKQGNFYTKNLRSAQATNTYILKGEGEETYEPHFTFFGFRYVKLEKFPGVPTLDNITGVVIHSDMPSTGSFVCSDSLINQLQHNIRWGQKGNFLDVPTDCPQRDERLGWTGDAQVFSTTAAFNFNVAAFFTKWMKDVVADQLPNGVVPFVIPDVLWKQGGSTAWADVAVIVPWNMYLAYGDQRILKEQYSSMKAWVDFMNDQAGDDHLWMKGYHFGDWLAFASNNSDYTGATTEKDLIANAYFAYSSGLLSKIAHILGNEQDAIFYGQLSDEVKAAFNQEYVTANGRLVSHTQTAYALALEFDLLPPSIVPKAAAYLAHDVDKFGHLTTGFVGTPLLCKALSDNGYAKQAFALLFRQEYPSWLYPVKQGATTIWERWDGQKPDGSFQDAAMNSFNHYAYGAVGAWMYHYIGGINIDPEQPGYKHILLAPHFTSGLSWANTHFESLYGGIVSDWKLSKESAFSYEIRIPANTSARVTLPQAKLNAVLMNGKAMPASLKARQEGNSVTLEVESGAYSFTYPLSE